MRWPAGLTRTRWLASLLVVAVIVNVIYGFTFVGFGVWFWESLIFEIAIIAYGLYVATSGRWVPRRLRQRIDAVRNYYKNLHNQHNR